MNMKYYDICDVRILLATETRMYVCVCACMYYLWYWPMRLQVMIDYATGILHDYAKLTCIYKCMNTYIHNAWHSVDVFAPTEAHYSARCLYLTYTQHTYAQSTVHSQCRHVARRVVLILHSYMPCVHVHGALPTESHGSASYLKLSCVHAFYTA
jgi:hypothetical protein